MKEFTVKHDEEWKNKDGDVLISANSESFSSHDMDCIG
jgi:hypothetical protein